MFEDVERIGVGRPYKFIVLFYPVFLVVVYYELSVCDIFGHESGLYK
jgi:hypothetical protein